MPFSSLTIAEITEVGEAAANTFQTRFGYTSATFEYIRVNSLGDITFVISLDDDFQRILPLAYRIDHEHYMNIDAVRIANLTPQTWRSREQRELAVLARQLGTVQHDKLKFESAQALAFMKTLEPLTAHINNLLERPKAD